MKTSLHRLVHAARPMLWASAAAAVSIAFSPEAAAQGKKGLQADLGEAPGGQPGAPGGQPGFPGGQPGFPGSGGEGAAPANLGPAPVPKFEMKPRTFADAVVTPDEKLTAGAPFNTKDYFAMPAEADNAGPLVLDALTSFGNTYGALNKSDTAGRDERFGNESAVTSWLRANANPRNWDGAGIEQALGAYRVVFAKLHEAHKKPECVIPTGIGVETLLPHIQDARMVAQLAPPLIFADLDRGDKAGAIDKFADALRLCLDLQPRSGPIALLAVTSMHRELAEKALPILLNAKGLSAADYDKILDVLVDYRSSSISQLPEVLKSEYLMQARTLDDLSTPAGINKIAKLLTDFSGGADGSQAEISKKLGTLFTSENVAKLKAAFGSILKDQLAAIESVGSPEEVAGLGKKLVDIQSKGTRAALASVLTPELIANVAGKGKGDASGFDLKALMGPGAAMLLGSNSTDFDKTVASVVYYQTQQGIMEALTATRRWYVTKKSTPNGKTLEEVAKEAGLEGAPLDSFSGKPLKLIWTGSGPAVVSIGFDRKDDAAKVLAAAPSNDNAQPAGDIIVTLALGGNPLAEVAAGGAGGAIPGGYGGQPGAPGAPGGYGGQPGAGGPPQAIAPGPGGRRGSGEGSSGGSGGPPQAIAPGPGNRGGSSGGSTAPGGASQAISPR